jgi:hypothetical protein
VGELTTIERLRLELTDKQATVDALMKGFQTLDFPIVKGLAFDVLYQPAATIDLKMRVPPQWSRRRCNQYRAFTRPATTVEPVPG